MTTPGVVCKVLNMNYIKTTEQCLAGLKRDYPAGQWSCSVTEGEPGQEPGEIDVTFQRYSDDAEDRYVIRVGSTGRAYSTQI